MFLRHAQVLPLTQLAVLVGLFTHTQGSGKFTRIQSSSLSYLAASGRTAALWNHDNSAFQLVGDKPHEVWMTKLLIQKVQLGYVVNSDEKGNAIQRVSVTGSAMMFCMI